MEETDGFLSIWTIIRIADVQRGHSINWNLESRPANWKNSFC